MNLSKLILLVILSFFYIKSSDKISKKNQKINIDGFSGHYIKKNFKVNKKKAGQSGFLSNLEEISFKRLTNRKTNVF